MYHMVEFNFPWKIYYISLFLLHWSLQPYGLFQLENLRNINLSFVLKHKLVTSTTVARKINALKITEKQELTKINV